MRPGSELIRVTLPTPHPPGRRQIGPGCAAAMEQQRAQERHGCSRRLSAEAALRRTTLRARGSHRKIVDCVALGPALSPASQDASADLPAQCWGPSAPTPYSEVMRLSVFALVSVRTCLLTDLLLFPGPVRLRATSKILPDFPPFSWKRRNPRAPCTVSAAPSPLFHPRTLLHCAGLWLGSRTF